MMCSMYVLCTYVCTHPTSTPLPPPPTRRRRRRRRGRPRFRWRGGMMGDLSDVEEDKVEEEEVQVEEEALGSSLTSEKVAAAQQFIENHYRAQRKNIKERRWVLERRLASSDVPVEEQMNLIKDLERKEAEFMRLKRHKICVDDFELLTIIGRGAFGEIRPCREKSSGNIYAMKKLKKSEMLSRG